MAESSTRAGRTRQLTDRMASALRIIARSGPVTRPEFLEHWQRRTGAHTYGRTLSALEQHGLVTWRAGGRVGATRAGRRALQAAGRFLHRAPG